MYSHNSLTLVSENWKVCMQTAFGVVSDKLSGVPLLKSVKKRSAADGKTLRGPCLVIVHTSDSDTSGTHWVVICIEKQQPA